MSLDPVSAAPTVSAPVRHVSANAHTSIALLALAFAIFLAAQIGAVGEQKKLLSWQITNAKTQEDNLVKAEKQLKDLAVQREGQVKQSQELQNKFQSILNDLMELAKDDKDAKEVVEAWKIQRTAPAAPAAPAADKSAPTP